ncbi:MAG: hypothetical protein WCA45_05180, partial [Thiobacillaceae bacterium]
GGTGGNATAGNNTSTSMGGTGGNGGMGGTATSDAMASATAGNGAAGGNGGNSMGGNAGTYDASNQLNNSINSTSGIVTVSQNTGANALTQIGTTVQANLTITGH